MSTITVKDSIVVAVTLTNEDESRHTRPKRMTHREAKSLATIHKGMRVSGPEGPFVVDHALIGVGEPVAVTVFRP